MWIVSDNCIDIIHSFAIFLQNKKTMKIKPITSIQSIILILSVVLCVSCVEKSDRNIASIDIAVADTNVVLPPAWAFGMLYGGYTNQAQTIERIDEIIAHDYPIDAYWIDSWFWSFDNKGAGPAKYIDFVADTVAYPNREKMWDYMQERNIKGGFWTWDCIFETGNEVAFKDFDEKGFFKNKYIETNPWHNYSTTTAMFETSGSKKGTLCGNIDFQNPEATAYFKQRMKPFFDEGADFLKLDRTSAISVCKTMFEITQELGKETKGRGFILSHTGGQETEEYKRYPGKWTDDTRSDWNIETPTKDFNFWVPKVAFKENIAMFTDTAKRSSEIPFMTNDVGGFDMGKTDQLDEELYIRWVQFSTFIPIVGVFSQPENPTGNLAYRYSTQSDSLFRQYAHWRMQLFPYIYSYAHQVRLKGEQMMQAAHTPFEYHFGNELLVAPVYEQFATSREILFPDGQWIDFWDNVSYQGGVKATVSAPIDKIPLFVRKGAIIPMRKYASSIERGTNDTLDIHIYPGEESVFTLIEDDGISNDYLSGKFSMTTLHLSKTNSGAELTISPVEGYYDGMRPERTWRILIHSSYGIKEIEANSNSLSFTKESNNHYASGYVKEKKSKKLSFKIHYTEND